MRKLIYIFLSLILVLSVSAPAYAVAIPHGNPSSSDPRISIIIVADQSTDVWRNPPRQEVNNERIAIAPSGSTFSYINTYQDPSGEYWYYVSIIAIDAPGAGNVLGARGYVSANTTHMQLPN